MRIFLLSTIALFTVSVCFAQDTTLVHTLNFDSNERTIMVEFPEDTGQTYEKVLMEYRIRCKDGLVSTGSNTNLGCGEWDYSCNTYITDSSFTDSIISKHPSHIITDFSGTTYNYSDEPTYTYYQSTQEEVTYTGVISESVATIGSGSSPSDIPFNNPTNKTKTQYLITAAELLGGGLIAGDLTGLRIDVNELGDEINNLRIKIKETSQSTLDPIKPELNGFSTVYYLNTIFSSIGSHQFNFSNNFSWDGTSNIIVEFTYDQTTGIASPILSETIAEYGISASESDFSLEFSGAEYITIPNSSSFETDEGTLEAWIRPSWSAGSLPYNPAIISNRNAGSSRYSYHISNNLNTIMMWSSSGGGYGEISYTFTPDTWYHLAFVSSGTSNVSVYINGINIGSIPTYNGTETGESLNIGHSGSGSEAFIGKIDEVKVWNTQLTTTEIIDYMHASVSASHPSYSNLVAYYDFNEGTGISVNSLTGAHMGTLINNPLWRNKKGSDLMMNFSALNERPNFEVLQGEYTISSTITTVLDSIINNPNIVISYQIDGTDIEAVDTSSYYQSGYTYVYDDITNDMIDSVFNVIQNTINISTLTYYGKYPSKFEILSFVTPYGIGLDLGINGKMWEFDVSDFMPILKGNKQLSVEFSGRYQEDMDIRFKFITGTPPRDVIDIRQVWRAGVRRRYTDLMADTYFEPRDFVLPLNSYMYKLRAAITGHGQEGEFIPRTHYLDINGGEKEVEWQVWKECSENPIYPQGGTWVYDRAGWCPGAATDLKEYEIDASTITGETMNIDYGVTSGSGVSDYYISAQLVSYGQPNFTNDAAIVDIQKPSNKVEYSRFNPACSNPIVTIQNTGSTDLTSLEIVYQVSGGPEETYNWTGNLSFLKTEQIILPISELSFWNGDETNTFTTSITETNGESDEYENNNSLSSYYTLSDIYEENFVIDLKTNNYGSQSRYIIKDYQGEIVFEKNNLSSNTTYKDTMNFENGCYTIELFDTGNDGLSWWANSAQGTGYFRLRTEEGIILKTFNPDFGGSIVYSFSIGNTQNINSEFLNSLRFDVFPNPATEILSISVSGIKSNDIKISLTNILGGIVKTKQIETTHCMKYDGTLDLSDVDQGTYFVEVTCGDQKLTKRIIVIE